MTSSELTQQINYPLALGLVIREDLGEVMQVTAIATGAEVQASPPKVPSL